jgi:hypothetical protein
MVFYGILLAFALAEEGAWDVLVWQRYLPEYADITLPALGEPWLSAVVATLALPQIVHYFLDAWIWKLDDSNPGLRSYLGLT